MADNTRPAGVCVGAGIVRSSEEWQHVDCLLCHNVQIYCPVVVCRTLRSLVFLCSNLEQR